MPDAAGRILGTGWSRKSEAAYERVFGTVPPAAAPEVMRYPGQSYDDWVDRWNEADYDQRRSAFKASD